MENAIEAIDLTKRYGEPLAVEGKAAAAGSFNLN